MRIIEIDCWKVKYNEFTKGFRFYTRNLSGKWKKSYKKLPMFDVLKKKILNDPDYPFLTEEQIKKNKELKRNFR